MMTPAELQQASLFEQLDLARELISRNGANAVIVMVHTDACMESFSAGHIDALFSMVLKLSTTLLEELLSRLAKINGEAR